MKAKREAEGASSNPLYARAIFKRKQNELPKGINDGKGQKHAYFSCYNSGQKAYDSTMAALASAGCFALMEAAQAYGTHIWVSRSFWTPDRKAAKLFLTWTGKTLKAIGSGECGYAVGLVVKEFCQLDDKSATQGGKLEIYSNPTSSWTAGTNTAELKVDPNTCSSTILCDPPA